MPKDKRKDKRWFRVLDTVKPGVTHIDIYGDIGGPSWMEESVGAKDFLDAVRDAGDDDIHLHVNSGGGSVFDAYAMMQALRNAPGHVTAHVEGLACSAASFLLAAADEVLVSPESWVMIHDASCVVYGNSSEMREQAAQLDKVDAQIAEIYATAAQARGVDKDEDDFRELMAATSWFVGAEIVDAGLADSIEDAQVEQLAATLDRSTIDAMPDAVSDRVKEGLNPLDLDSGQRQEPPEPVAQERTVVVDGHIFKIIEKEQ